MRIHGVIMGLLALTVSVSGCAVQTGDERGEAQNAEETVEEVSQALAPTCVTIQRGAAGDIADAKVRSEFPNANFGALETFVTGDQFSQRYALLRYDLSSIPAGNVITSATATLTEVSNLGASTVDVHRVTAPWSEGSVTANSFASSFDPAVAASFSNGGAGHTGAISFDLTSLAQGWYSGSIANHGVAMMAPTNSTWASSEATSPSARPSLTVCYAPPPYQAQGLIGGTTGATGTRACPANQGITSLGTVNASWYEVGSVSPSCGLMTENGSNMDITAGASLGSYGSNQTGPNWGAGNVSCPSGTIATGLFTRHDFVYIYGFQLRCSTLDSNGFANGPLQTSAFVGQGGLGTTTVTDCPAGYVLSGLNMWDTLYGFYGVQPLCSPAIGL